MSDNPFGEPGDTDCTIIRPAGRVPPPSPGPLPPPVEVPPEVVAEEAAGLPQPGTSPLLAAAAPLLALFGRLGGRLGGGGAAVPSAGVRPVTGFRSCAATHAGVRRPNQDSYVNRSDLGLWAVADGAGGHDAGELAAATIREALEAVPPGLEAGRRLAEVRRRLVEVHAALRAEAVRRGPGAVIASTVAVLMARAGHVAALWAGDSRVYLLREGGLSQITRDHSLVQEMVDAGVLTAAAAERHPRANIITRAVGGREEFLTLDKVTGALLPGDRFLLCSDGLSKVLPAAEMAALLALPVAESAGSLVAAAVAQGARDDVTVVVVAAD